MDRRHFLKAGAAASLAAPLATAPAWETRLRQERRQVRVAEVEAFAVPRAIYAKVTADDGTTGWGECGHNGGVMVAGVVARVLRDLLVGMDVFDTEPMWNRMYFEADELGPGGLASQAIAGVDCALWDLRGKLLGEPVWALLGGKFVDRVELYGSFSRSLGGGRYMEPTQAAETAVAHVEEGFRTLKLRLAIREENQDPKDDPAFPMVEAVRRAVGDDVTLYVDANNGYSAARAIQVGRVLAADY
ncbi:MAG: enolase C-terminal domain-like protein, partial [Bacteroidota bacterium]